ncbi:hypothetical protein EDB19DRAFT_1908235 [Suillus lakei]|nr:hypothetical protein EDB19DRAFT_1908235 [Suillus lakei]
MAKAKGKRKSTQTDGSIEIKVHQVKGGDGMNFDKTFWVAAAAELAAESTGIGTAKSADTCYQKWGQPCKRFKVVDKADPFKADPQISTWTGLHTSMDLNTNTSTPTGSSSTSDIIMMSLENMLENVKFSKSANTEMMPVSQDPQTQSSTIPPQVAPPITPISSHNVVPHFFIPSLGSASTPASSTAIKHKTLNNDSSHQESRPPHSLKSCRSVGGSSKSQHLTMPLALEELGGKVSGSIDTTTTALQEAVVGHFVEPVPVCKQKAIHQVQEEHDPEDHEVLMLIEVF